MAEEIDEPTSDCGGYDLTSPSGYVTVHLCGSIEDAERWSQVRKDVADLIEILKPVASTEDPSKLEPGIEL